MFRSLERQTELLDGLTDAVIVRNLDGQIFHWSHGAEILYGWSSEQGMGEVIHEFLRTIFPVPLEDIKKVLSDTHNWDGDLHQTTRDGSMVIVSSRLGRSRPRKQRLRNPRNLPRHYRPEKDRRSFCRNEPGTNVSGRGT